MDEYLTLSLQFSLQNLTKLCSVVTDCVSSFCVDFWLQTHLYQAGVLWSLLIYLFNYDFTLEEGGVESSDSTNQQVWPYTIEHA